MRICLETHGEFCEAQGLAPTTSVRVDRCEGGAGFRPRTPRHALRTTCGEGDVGFVATTIALLSYFISSVLTFVGEVVQPVETGGMPKGGDVRARLRKRLHDKSLALQEEACRVAEERVALQAKHTKEITPKNFDVVFVQMDRVCLYGRTRERIGYAYDAKRARR